jgi:hypothetical protein
MSSTGGPAPLPIQQAPELAVLDIYQSGPDTTFT